MSLVQIIRQTVSDFVADKCPRMAAALAYYTAFSLAPTLVLIITIGQLVFEPSDIRGRVESELNSVVGDQGTEQIRTILESDKADGKRSTMATVVSTMMMLVGASGLFVQLQAAMNDVWSVEPDPRRGGVRQFIIKRLVSLGMVLTIAFLIMVSMTVSATVHAFDDSIERWMPSSSGTLIVQFADYLISFGILTVLFAAMFKFLPDAQIRWRDVLVGSVATATLFVVGKFAIAMYVGSQNMADSYGAAGSLVVILIWVYYSAIILLLGAEFTEVWSQAHGSRIQPEDGAVRVITRVQRVSS